MDLFAIYEIFVTAPSLATWPEGDWGHPSNPSRERLHAPWSFDHMTARMPTNIKSFIQVQNFHIIHI
jgi:hypothetical protein